MYYDNEGVFEKFPEHHPIAKKDILTEISKINIPQIQGCLTFAWYQ